MGQHLPFPSSPLAGLDGIPKNQQKNPETGAGDPKEEKIMNIALHPFDQFAERLDKLERRNRRLTGMLVLLLVAGGLVLLGAAQKPKRQSSDMESFVLRDSAGKERARLEMGKEGPALQFLNEKGQTLATVATGKDALLLRLFDRNGHLQTGVSLEKDGVALVNYDRDGQLQRGRGALLFTNGVFARD
jgi:hypothetical protein